MNQVRVGITTLAAVVVSLALSASAEAAKKPDLVIAAIANPPASAGAGDAISVRDTTRNAGRATAKASTTAYWLSADGRLSGGDIPLSPARKVPKLRPGKKSAGSKQVTIPAAATPGSYRLIACAAAPARIAESKEGNNCKASAAAIAVADVTAPAAPLLAIAPDSPANENAPHALGAGAEPAAQIEIYANGGCLGTPVAAGAASGAGAFDIALTVEDDTTTTFTATATDAADNTSPCSNAVVYIEDSTAPEAPGGLTTTPGTPGNDATPALSGSASEGTIQIYKSDDCSGEVAASGGAGAFSGAGIDVAVAENAFTWLSTTATDAAGNVSACSAPVRYGHTSAPLESEPNGDHASADPVTGTAIAGSIDPVGDHDFYAITLGQASSLTAQTSSIDGNTNCSGDTKIWLYGTDGTTLLASDDDDGPALCSRIDPAADTAVENLAAGTYYLEVAQFDDTTPIASYKLTVAPGDPILPPAAAPEVEPNNTSAEAAAAPASVRIAQNRRISGAIDPIGDVDTFQVTLAAAGVLQLETRGADGRSCAGIGTKIELLAAGGTTVINSDLTSGVADCSALILRLDAGTYYARVRDAGDDATIAGYQLHATFLADGGAEAEPNGAHTEANTVPAGSYVSGAHPDSADFDYYALTVPEGGAVRAEIIEGDDSETCELNGIDSQIALLAPDGTSALVQDDDDGRGFCSLIDGTGKTPRDAGAANLTAGTYYIRVRSSQFASVDGAVFNYRLVLSSPAGAVEVEPNDTPAAANPLNAGEPLRAAITPVGDTDWFAIRLDSNRALTVETTAPGGGACGLDTDTLLRIYAPDGTTELAMNDDKNGISDVCSRLDGSADAPLSNLAPGTYYARVTHYNDTQAIAAYRITYTTSAPVP